MDETIYVILKVLFDFALEVWFSIYLSTHTVHVHAGAIRKLMCGLFACTSDSPLS